MGDIAFTKEDWLTVCKNQPEQSKTVLIDQLNFTVDGVKEVYEKNPQVSSVFFSEFIEEPFSATDGQVIKVLERGFHRPENMAKVMEFMYNNQTEEQKKESKMDSTATEKKKGRGRGKVDWASRKIPFTDGTMEYIVFEEMLKFGGTVSEFLSHIKTVFEAKSLIPKSSLSSLIRVTIVDANKEGRGWAVSVVDNKYKLEKIVVKVA